MIFPWFKTPVRGYVEKGFEAVYDVFEQNFREGREVGAAVAIYYRREKVVDLWAGHMDIFRRKPWKEDTMALVFSTTKGLTSLALALLHSRKLIDYDEKVAAYWPEFAQNGKENITLKQLLSHSAGLAAIDVPLDGNILRDNDRLAKILAAQKPNWKPGSRSGYHAWTIGMYQAELIRRIDPKSRNLRDFFHEELALPLGLEIYIGQPDSLPDDRIADIIPFEPLAFIRNKSYDYQRGFTRNLVNVRSVASKSFTNPMGMAFIPNFNKRETRSLVIGSGTGIATARSIAALYGEFATGGKALNLSPGTIAALEDYPAAAMNHDFILDVPLNFSLGFAKPSPHIQFGPTSRSYGNFGAGGSFGYADPENGVGFAYIMNVMGTTIGNDARERRLRDAFYNCIR